MTNRPALSLHLDFRSKLPIYTQIVHQVEQQVSGGTLKPDTQLPTVRALASELRINFNTVARAYRLLDEAGVISTQRGRGTYIMEKPLPEAGRRLRREALEALARQYIGEAKRLEFSEADINQAIKDQLKSWDDARGPNGRS